MKAWDTLQRDIAACELCPRLREHCRQIGREKRKAYAAWDYWSRPVPDFGQPPPTKDDTLDKAIESLTQKAAA